MMSELQRRERRPIGDCELPIDMMQMNLDCAIRNIQQASHLFVGQSFGYQMHDLAFPLRQHHQHISIDCVAVAIRERKESSAINNPRKELHQCSLASILHSY